LKPLPSNRETILSTYGLGQLVYDTMTFQEIRIIATGPYITNQLPDVNTICCRSLYIAAHIWKIYDFEIEI
jgi:hypothetical protein